MLDMKQNKSMSLRVSVKILTAIFLCSNLFSCNGQVNKTSINKEVNSSDSELSTSKETPEPFIFPNFTNQIAETVRVMFHDSKDNFWFGTHSGVLKLVNGSLVYIDGIRSESDQRVAIRAISEDVNGKIWFGHTDGISYLDGDTIVNLYESDGLISNDVWHLTPDSKGNIWVGTIKGVSKYDGKNFTHFELPEGEIDTTIGVSSTKMIHNILEDSKGRIWFSTNAGIFIKDNNDLTAISEKDGFKTNFVGKVIENQKGEFMICTSKGLYIYKEGSLTDISSDLFEESKGIGNITETSNGEIWFNCGRSIYSLSNNKLTEHRISEGNYGPLTYQIYSDRYGRVWFVGWGGAFRFENGEILNITKDGPW
jgi:ligand-binding sensor domain-containing protein